MSQNASILALTILIIAAGLYFMYGSPFSKQNVNLSAYQEMCDKYRTATQGTYTQDEMQMLVNEISYLVTDEVKDIKDAASKNLKLCGQDLSAKLSAKSEQK